MAGFGNSGRMLPSRCGTVSIRPTTAGSSAREPGGHPLAWSMAGFIRLAHGVEAGEPVETPTVVRDRYVERDRSATPDLDATAEYVNNHLVVAGETTADVVAVYTPDESALVTVEDGEYEFRLDAALDAKTVVVAAANTDGGADDTAADAGDEATDTDAILDEFSGAGTAVKRLRV